jgi:hypothetical protein
MNTLIISAAFVAQIAFACNHFDAKGDELLCSAACRLNKTFVSHSAYFTSMLPFFQISAWIYAEDIRQSRALMFSPTAPIRIINELNPNRGEHLERGAFLINGNLFDYGGSTSVAENYDGPGCKLVPVGEGCESLSTNSGAKEYRKNASHHRDRDTANNATLLRGMRCSIEHLFFSSDGMRLYAAGDYDSKLVPMECMRWDTRTWTLENVSSIRNVGFRTPSMEHLFRLGQSDESHYEVIDMQTEKIIGRIEGADRNGLQGPGYFSPGGNYFVFFESDEKRKEYDVIYDIPSGKRRGRIPRWPGSPGAIGFCTSKELVAVISPDCQVYVFSIQTGKPIMQGGIRAPSLPSHLGKSALAISPDGKELALWEEFEGTIQVWSVKKGTLSYRLPKREEEVRARICLAWSPDSRMLAVAGAAANFGVELYERTTLKCRRVLEGHSAPVYSLAFAPDGQSLAAGSKDKTALVWNLRE